MTVPKAVVESTFDLQRKRIRLTDAPPVPSRWGIDFQATMAAIVSRRYDGGRWELSDVRLVRDMDGELMEMNLYGNNLSTMPQWLVDLVHAEMPRG